MGVRQLDLEAYETPEKFFADFDHEVGRRVTVRIMPQDYYVAPDHAQLARQMIQVGMKLGGRAPAGDAAEGTAPTATIDRKGSMWARKVSEADARSMLAQRQQGEPIKDIAERMGVSIPTVRKWIAVAEREIRKA